ncbi:DUF5959 family protein [Actinophytocola sp. NPDC049390]|uniref:DUF5959 family protein n=1 Tax=Actinophytocola sp. NPDC049390 TaxID=3363894 RepID=UPI0037972D68
MADPIDLIHLEGHGNKVVLRITGVEPGELFSSLTGEFLIETPFVRGRLHAWFSRDDLWEWRDALDALDVGEDVAWRADARGASVFVERFTDRDLALITIKDDEGAATAVTVTVPMPDSWFDDAYERLDLVLKTLPPA